MVKTTRRMAALIAAACVVAVATAADSDTTATKRLPVPSAESIATFRDLIRHDDEADYKAAKRSGEYAALLKKLRDYATTAPDPGKKYVYLLEGEEVAADNGDVAATLEMVDKRAEVFEIDGLEERAKALTRLAATQLDTPRTSPDLALFEQARSTATKAVAAERFDVAENCAKLAIEVALAIDEAQKNAKRRRHRSAADGEFVPTANGAALIKSAVETKAWITRLKKLFDEYRAAKVVLGTRPDDPDGNTKAGTYLCLAARRWDEGLPHLRKSGLGELSRLAAEELDLGAMASADVNNVLPLADKWWDMADNKNFTYEEQTAVRDHAKQLYRGVLPNVTNPLLRHQVKLRCRDGEPLPASGSP